MQRVHEKLKPFACETCGTSFYAKGDLERHCSLFIVHLLDLEMHDTIEKPEQVEENGENSALQ